MLLAFLNSASSSLSSAVQIADLLPASLKILVKDHYAVKTDESCSSPFNHILGV